MTDYYDALETRNPADREADLFARLPDVLRAAMKAPAYAERLKGIDPAKVTSRAALAALPVLRKSDLPALHKAAPPFGGLVSAPLGAFGRIARLEAGALAGPAIVEIDGRIVMLVPLEPDRAARHPRIGAESVIPAPGFAGRRHRCGLRLLERRWWGRRRSRPLGDRHIVERQRDGAPWWGRGAVARHERGVEA